MRHEVEWRFGGQAQVMHGILIGSRPDRFWVRAQTPVGGTLFDVRSSGAGRLEVDLRMADVANTLGPYYLARDIRRIYFADCPAGSPASEASDGVRVTCRLPPSPEPSPPPELGQLEPADDALSEALGADGLLRAKCFSRAEQPTVCVFFEDYGRDAGPTPLARRIHLEHLRIPYALTIALLEADTTFQAARLFEAKP